MLHPNLLRELNGDGFGHWKPSWTEMRDAVKWSKINDRHLGDFSSVRSGALDYLNGLYIIHLEAENKALLNYKEEVEAIADTMYQYIMKRLADTGADNV